MGYPSDLTLIQYLCSRNRWGTCGLPLGSNPDASVLGAGGVLVGYPLDTVKVRIQIGEPGRYRGTFHCLSQIVKTEGVSILEHSVLH